MRRGNHFFLKSEVREGSDGTATNVRLRERSHKYARGALSLARHPCTRRARGALAKTGQCARMAKRMLELELVIAQVLDAHEVGGGAVGGIHTTWQVWLMLVCLQPSKLYEPRPLGLSN
uniref:Uncharacterized protein n=1 Tax=Micrurus lemniscatus lemniscatus TaxID=129467 RepID=A0A2D4J5D6_MICLE